MSAIIDEPILVVYDSEGIRETVQLLDSGLCPNTLEAVSEEQALHLQKNHTPSLTILCAMARDTWTYRLCRRLKQDAGDHFLPILILALRDPEETKQRARDAGADECMLISSSPESLQQAVRTLLAARRIATGAWSRRESSLRKALQAAEDEVKRLRGKEG
ncbi:MAG: response regulator [Planctomycetota bacterium]